MLILSKKKELKKAVTLMELMVTIIIIGILTAIAIPMFPKAMENTKAKEAVAALHQIRTGERVYRVEENTYWGPSVGIGITEIRQINDTLRVFLDYRVNRNWNYSVGVATTQAFTATATRTGSGSHGTETIVFDQDGLDPTSSTWTLPLSGQ